MTEDIPDVSKPKSAEPSVLSQIVDFIWQESTFFRVHLTAFVFIPLIFSGIFYACNGQFHIRYIDALFLCYSAMTVTGLSTVNLSTVTAWQQVMLYILMVLGNTTMVSWIMVLVRRQYFRKKCEEVVYRPRPVRSRSVLKGLISGPKDAKPYGDRVPEQPGVKKRPWSSPDIQIARPTPGGSLVAFPTVHTQPTVQFQDPPRHISESRSLSSSPRTISSGLPVASELRSHSPYEATSTGVSPTVAHRERMLSFRGDLPRPQRSMTVLMSPQSRSPEMEKYQGFGGFPGPVTIIRRLFKRAAPRTYNKFERQLTLPHTITLEEKKVPWLKFDGLVVGRNSDFHTETLSDDQIEQLGGTEYRALDFLSYMIPVYFVATQLVAYTLFAPWLSVTSTYNHVFDSQARYVAKPWFSMFLVTSAYAGCGLSLVDTSMLPFQEAYLMIFGIIFILLAGNHALPVFLRFFIWIGYKFTNAGSDLHDTLSFLLHHPRRCFLYLFPSHQTWFLFIVLVFLSSVEWFTWGVLNIGLDVLKSLPMAPRVIIGLFQGVAVRASGLTIVPIGSLAPALQFLYIVLMYIAVYPVAMCIRTTNVYEERSLGIFENVEGEIQENFSELEFRERIGRYLGWHLRHQMSNDLWWLVWGIFLVAIIERGPILDEGRKWFNLFSVIFELISAFAGIGLSFGVPYDNYSFSGGTRTLSKLVIIVIMIRGRHRGLPVAVDRAVMLPSEMVTKPRTDPEPNNPDTNGAAQEHRSPIGEEAQAPAV